MAANTTTTRSHYEEITTSNKKGFGKGHPNSTTQSVYGIGPSFGPSFGRPASNRGKYASSEYGGTRRRPFNSGVTKKDIDSMASDLGPEFVNQRMNEKENLKNLNNRFASYIEKVRSLEVQNKALEAKLDQIQKVRPAGIDKMYEEEMRRLRQEVNELTNIKDRTELQRDNLSEDCAKWRDK